MILELKNLKKSYGTVPALKGINYSFSEGIYGILGANGAGKSTMINLITDNLPRDKHGLEGDILFEGEEILKLGKKFREHIGYMPQQQGFYDDFSPRTFLKYMAEIKGVRVNKEIDELLEVVNLSDYANKKIGEFSGGMRQRVLLAQALLGNPKIIILDEPTAGLDPTERINIRNYIAQLSKDKIILFSTHVVSDIECVADRILLLKKGEIIVEGTPKELIQSIFGKVGEIFYADEDIEQIKGEFKIGNIKQKKDGKVLRVVGNQLPQKAIIIEENISLEDVYLYYVD